LSQYLRPQIRSSTCKRYEEEDEYVRGPNHHSSKTND
jgi:hypothetical protein